MANLDEHFNFLKSIKKDEYSLKEEFIDLPESELRIKQNLTSGAVIIEELRAECKLVEGKWIVSDKVINHLSPDNLDSREFWKGAVETFPLFSIAGGPDTNKNKEDVNEATMGLHKGIGVLDWLIESMTGTENKDYKMLEIGPGYGNIFYPIIAKHNLESCYYSIDVNPLFYHDNMYQCDGRNIPEQIPNELDMIYSINVFQHLSKAQRLSYYQQAFKKLRSGGKFIVGTFCVTPTNIHEPIWGHRDEHGNFYAVFLGQYTEIERVESWVDILRSVGFEIIRGVEHGNYVSFELKKP